MEFLLPLLNPNAFKGQDFGGGGFEDLGLFNGEDYPGYGFAPRCGGGGGGRGCGSEDQRPCSSQQAKAAAEQEQQQQWPGFGFGPTSGQGQGPSGFNLEDFLGTAAAFVASLADVQSQNQSTPTKTEGSSRPKSPLSSNGFQIKFDVAQFKPEELTMQVVDKFIVLEGVHEEQEDEHGFVSRRFTRRIPIPAGIDADKINCSFTAAGQLIISAPKVVPSSTSASATQADADVPAEAATAAEEKSVPVQKA